MVQVELRSTAAGPVTKFRLRRRFVIRLIASSVSSVAGTISFALTGPLMCRVAAIDPALEAFYLALVVAWFWSLARMWSLTFLARNRNQR